jgi:hypothetical protein
VLPGTFSAYLIAAMRAPRKNIAKGPRTQSRDLATKQNRQLPAQTRKILGRHYAAKYRVR